MKLTRRRTPAALGATLSATALLLAACSGTGASGTSAAGDAGKPRYGGVLTFYDPVGYRAWQVANTLWSNSNVTPNLVDRLTWQDPRTGRIEPWLAKSWTISEDHLTYTFRLRSGVTFSDGTQLTAQVVKDNLDQHGFGNKAAGVAPDQFFANYVGTTVTGPLTVKVRLSQPNAAFLQVLSIYRTGIVAKSYLRKNWNDQGRLSSLIGSGPFVVAGGNGTTGVVLERRDDYDWAPPSFRHQGKAYLSEIRYTTVPEQSTAVGGLQSGQADVVRNIAPDDEETVRSSGGQVRAFPAQGESNQLHISLAANAPTKDLRVRQALQAATDRKEINQVALSPSYGIGTGILVRGTPDRPDGSAHLTYDLARAKRLLDKAGWRAGSDGIRAKDSTRLSFTLYVTPYYQVSQAVVEVLQSQWKKAGIEVKLKTPSMSEYEAEISKDTVFTQGQLSRAEPDVLRSEWHSDLVDATYTEIPALDRLLEAQVAEFDPSKRAAAVEAIQDYILKNALTIPLYDETQVYGLRSTVHGFQTEAVARSTFYNTWLS
ncbi:ABC transporter substrate-binding protein [Streptomyces shenzhenensis]|uniref:ABC transporter substrate-binding protein n=1 Tax=Streptomyces shenzhenensis TaxID=943815 RepID=A0A3M0I9M4_9ACTN|nr:ABC transporter substrate-binding protein [Streptomyces shenzhenensis]RMB85052.1 ABC transporter substrate-binding protein [Streptomyces shenzhenensis]